MHTEPFFKQFFFPNYDDISIIIEDDLRVSYAYLLNQDDIVSDVWLFNILPTPDRVDWKDKNQMPFLNPIAYVGENQNFLRIGDESEITISWPENPQAGTYEIIIKGVKLAALKYGCFPGWSSAVKKDGPLALKWEL